MRNAGTRPLPARTSSARRSSSSIVSSGGGPRSTVTTQSWQARPRTTQLSQSILVVMRTAVPAAADSPPATAPGPGGSGVVEALLRSDTVPRNRHAPPAAAPTVRRYDGRPDPGTGASGRVGAPRGG